MEGRALYVLQRRTIAPPDLATRTTKPPSQKFSGGYTLPTIFFVAEFITGAVMKSISLRSRRLLPLAIALALGVPAADAATITVTTAGDAGSASTCTLRQAIDSANNDS